VVVGISDEKVETVKPYVDKMADQMAYVVACDQGRRTSEGYMKAFGQGGIPCAFIVGKQGTVVWLGHPMENLDTTLEEILAGKYDLEAAKQKDEARALMDEFQRLSNAGDAQAKALGAKLLTRAGSNLDELCNLAFAIVANTKNEHRDFAFADQVLDQAEKVVGGQDARVVSVRAIGRFEAGQQAEGIRLVKEAIALSKSDPDKKKYQGYLQVMEKRQQGAAKP
jgi:hypothetical protein